MSDRDDLFFLSDDMGAPILDNIRAEFSDRFINVGIAEQNLINVASGLALEGYTVFAYGIAPFFMRCYEQIRVNLAILGQARPQNVNMIAVGCGVSYDVSGPTHHCLEDLTLMRLLPNVELFSPCDPTGARAFIDWTLDTGGAKYIRLDGKPQTYVYPEKHCFDWQNGFSQLRVGDSGICLISTGFMTHKALELAEDCARMGTQVSVVDIFLLGSKFNQDAFADVVRSEQVIFTLEEGFIGKGGLDALVKSTVADAGFSIQMKHFGFQDEYLFKYGAREYLHRQHGFDQESLKKALQPFLIDSK
jgi:transketolase